MAGPDELTPAALKRIEVARARFRRHVWAQLPKLPASQGSNTVTDHIAVLSQAIAQVPATYRQHLLIRAEGAGSSYGLLDWLTAQDAKHVRTLEYSVGYPTNQRVRDAIAKVPKKVWTPATNADGDVREGVDVAEITNLLDLSGCPAGMHLIFRRQRPHPGA